MALEQNGRVVLKVYEAQGFKLERLLIARPFDSEQAAQEWFAEYQRDWAAEKQTGELKMFISAMVPRI